MTDPMPLWTNCVLNQEAIFILRFKRLRRMRASWLSDWFGQGLRYKLGFKPWLARNSNAGCFQKSPRTLSQ